MKKIFDEKYRKSVPSTVIVVTFLKLYRYRYRRYFFGKVSVPISLVLLKYRVPTSAYCIGLTPDTTDKVIPVSHHL